MNSNLIHPSFLSVAARVATRSALLSLAVFVSSALAQSVAPVKLNWLDGQPPAVPQSVSWGVPWPKGQVQKNDSLVLKTADGKVVPAQTWPLAYWPDGSIMWSGQSIVAMPDMAGPFQLAVGAASAPAVKITCTQDDRAITVDTGAIKVRLPKSGSSLVESIMIGDRTHDIRAARMNGARSVGVLWGYGSRDELAGADAVVTAPSELPATLARVLARG